MGLLEFKKLSKFRFLGCFSIVKTEECDLKVGNFFDQIGINIPCSATYFVEVGARVSLKIATKVYIRHKKNSENLNFSVVFLKSKRRSAT